MGLGARCRGTVPADDRIGLLVVRKRSYRSGTEEKQRRKGRETKRNKEGGEDAAAAAAAAAAERTQHPEKSQGLPIEEKRLLKPSHRCSRWRHSSHCRWSRRTLAR
jgi:hypothetical protein